MEWVSLMTLSQQKLLRTQREEAIEGVAPSTQEGERRKEKARWKEKICL